MKKMERYSRILVFIIVIFGLLIIPTISRIVFGDNICGHTTMNLVGLVIVLIGLYSIIKEK